MARPLQPYVEIDINDEQKQGNVPRTISRRREALGRPARRSANRRRRRAAARRRRRAQNPAEPCNTGLLDSPSINFDSLVQGDLRHFVEAVTNPFDDGAIGAIMPDRWQPPTVPAHDRISLDLDPSLYVNGVADGFTTMSGFMIALVPRSLATGWLNSGGPSEVGVRADFTNVDSDFNRVTAVHQADQYCLMVSALGTTGLFPNPTWSQIATQTSGMAPELVVIPGYNTFRFSKFEKMQQCCEKARIVGAGLKVWSDEAPINTGGTVYGGWMTAEDLIRSFDGTSKIAPGNSQDLLTFRRHEQAVHGITVRYSPLQDPEQENFVDTHMGSEYVQVTYDPVDGAVQSADAAVNLNLSVYDQVRPGTYIPCVVWRYNSATLDDGYSLRVEARVHLQCNPNGECPFLSYTPKPDPIYATVVMMLENKELFPVAVKGHSFKKFITKVRSLAVKGSAMAGKVANFLALADKAVGAFSL